MTQKRTTENGAGTSSSPGQEAVARQPAGTRRPRPKGSVGQVQLGHLEQAAVAVRRLCRLRPKLAVVLGSGFHRVTERLELEVAVPYWKLPGFPLTTVAGHAGQLLAGRLGGCPVLVLSGRAHYYEGQSLDRVTWPIRVLAAAGIRDLLLTNAAGGLNPKFRPGDFMLLTDHINLMGANPLRGWPTATHVAGRERHSSPPGSSLFVDLTCAYDAELRSQVEVAARDCGLSLRRGIYLAVSGPSYETPAEIRAFRRLGADAVGMSTVPEVIVGRHCGLRVASLSCITNLAAGISRTPLSHAEVLAMAEQVGARGADLLEAFARRYATSAMAQ